MLPITLTIPCAICFWVSVRYGFPLKRNTISLFVQAKLKKKNHTLTTNPPPQTPFLKHMHDHRSALHLYNTHRSMLIP